jgi:predicted O-methyltransferase YrrM
MKKQGEIGRAAMSNRSIELTDALHDYMVKVSVREHKVLQKLRAETRKMPRGKLQISPEQGQLMGLLAELIGAKRAFEVGTFTGYSALSVALALPANGKLIACDVSKEWTDVGRRYWKMAKVDKKIDLRIGPAIGTLDGLLKKGQAGKFDIGFIDADKPNYDGYYERGLKLLRKGGLLLIDNVLWGGSVIDKSDNDESTRCVRALNKKVHGDRRVTCSMLPIGDGLTLVRKR